MSAAGAAMSAAEATRHRKHLTQFLPGASSVAHSSPPAARWSNRSRYARSAQSGNGRDRTSSGYRVTGGHRATGGYAGQLYPFSSVGGPNNQYLQLVLAALAAKAYPISPLYLPYISPTSPLHLPLHLPYVSPTSPLHLPYIFLISPPRPRGARSCSRRSSSGGTTQARSPRTSPPPSTWAPSRASCPCAAWP